LGGSLATAQLTDYPRAEFVEILHKMSPVAPAIAPSIVLSLAIIALVREAMEG
jgi:hypothetical protein